MTETDEKPEKKKPVKQGLHGWKAALAMFGCGSLAAFGVFGIVFALLGSVLSVFSDGAGATDSSEPLPQATANPRGFFDKERFDLCAISEDISGVNLDIRESEGIEDTSLDGGEPSEDDLVRSDECSGVLTSSVGERWDFTLSYKSIIYSPQGDEDDLAYSYFEDVSAENSLEGGSGGKDFLDEAQFSYEGLPGEGADFTAASIKRSTVILVNLASPSEQTEETFYGELKKFEVDYNIALNVYVPE